VSERSLSVLRAALDAALVGQDEAKTGLLMALLAREHAYLEGPPGSGKTQLAEALAVSSGARVAGVHFDRDVKQTDLLGNIRIRRRPFGSGERIVRELEEGPLLRAEVAVLDDLDRAPREAIRPLLRILGQRVGLETVVATGSSPRSDACVEPLEPGARDRFAIQIRMRGLLVSGVFAQARALLDRPTGEPALPRLTPLERRELQDRVARIPLDDSVRHDLVSLVRTLAGALGREAAAVLTDRVFAGAAVRILRAHAVVRGGARVEREDLRALRLMLGARLPESARDLFDGLLAEFLKGEETRSGEMVAGLQVGQSSGPGGAGLRAARFESLPPGLESPLEGRAEERRASLSEAAEVEVLLRALGGRIERARADRGDDPGGSPRGYKPLEQMDEILDADPADAVLFVEGRLPGGPRAYRRERRNRGGSLAVLRDVSASMEGRLSRWAGEVVAGIVRSATKRRMRMGYVEFNHRAERFSEGKRFFHRRYGRLLALAGRRRSEGRTNYEAPLQAALSEFRRKPGRNRHLVMLTDGVPVLGDPHVSRQRSLARELGVQVHTVFLGLGDCPGVLDEISRETGGARFLARPGRDGRLRVRLRGASA
jgi:MoxR-like ATPase